MIRNMSLSLSFPLYKTPKGTELKNIARVTLKQRGNNHAGLSLSW